VRVLGRVEITTFGHMLDFLFLLPFFRFLLDPRYSSSVSRGVHYGVVVGAMLGYSNPDE